MSTTENNKRSKPDDPSNSPISEYSNSDLARLIKNQGKTTEGQITQLGADLRAELKSGLDGIKKEIDAVTTNLAHLKLEVDSNSADIARLRLSNDVIISGVPFIGKEDLHQYFNAWCEVLGYAENTVPIVDIRRLSKVALRDGNHCFILVQFAFTNQRHDFYGRYLRSRCLTLRHIGFQSDNRVYVNENLIPTARTIKAEALDLKKEGKITSVYSRNGVIYVKAANCDQDRPIRSVEQLQEFRSQ